MLRKCSACKERKSTTEFHFSNKIGRLAGYCKNCNKIKCKEYGRLRRERDPDFVERERMRSQKQRSQKSYRVYNTWERHRSTAVKRGIDFTLTKEDVQKMFDRNEWKCCKTGIEFDLSTGRGTRPFSPSIDRIDSKGHYTKDNVQLVCTIYNFAKNRFSETDVVMFATSLTHQHHHAVGAINVTA